MFTLIRPVAALILAIFSYYAAEAYEPFFDPDLDLGRFPIYAAGVGAVMGWFFLGGQVGRAWWFSIYAALQAIVLTAIGTAMLLAVGQVFSRGFQRMYGTPFEAFTGYFEIVVDWLGRALVVAYWLPLAGWGVGVGIALHALQAAMENRRNAR